MKRVFTFALALIVIGQAFAIVGNMDIEDAQQEENFYCEMVNEFKASNGESGWPDYQGNYNEVCL